MPRPELVLRHRKPGCKLSIILLDWGVRESFHSLHYLNEQSASRADYELIWLEFYKRKPLKLQEMIFRHGKESPLIDQWIVAGYDDNVIFNKHRLYNLGILAAQGEYCVICDSDAIFTPNFVARLLDEFERTPGAVLHLDEIRNADPRFHPFSYPSIDEVLGPGCINWHGTVSRGLNNSTDMLHDANYGACMAAARSEMIAIGGADEHLDYLGYICGPYDMTFRFVNKGLEERWLRDEYLYHVWHPNENGINTDYQGPHDGKFMSKRSLESRVMGRIMPCLENPWIQRLRQGKSISLEEALQELADHDEPTWLVGNEPTSEPAYMVERDYRGFDLYIFDGRWYGLQWEEGLFDPRNMRRYRNLLQAPDDYQLKLLIDYYHSLPTHWWQRLTAQPLHRLPGRVVRRLSKEISRLF